MSIGERQQGITHNGTGYKIGQAGTFGKAQ